MENAAHFTLDCYKGPWCIDISIDDDAFYLLR